MVDVATGHCHGFDELGRRGRGVLGGGVLNVVKSSITVKTSALVEIGKVVHYPLDWWLISERVLLKH